MNGTEYRRSVPPPTGLDSIRLMSVRDGSGNRHNLGVGVTRNGQVALVEVEFRVIGVLNPHEVLHLQRLLREALTEAALKD